MDAFQQFINETKNRFFHFLVRLTGNTERASDAFQESYLRYWERYDRDAPSASLLFTIGRNIAMDGHRRRKHHLEVNDQSEDPQPDQESTVILKESYFRVLEAMEKLDPMERELLSLVADGGFRYEQIAGMTRLSVANVKVKIHRARQKLRRMLEEA